jgi:hypothetical protein
MFLQLVSIAKGSTWHAKLDVLAIDAYKLAKK